jgi:hypothetical protein
MIGDNTIREHWLTERPIVWDAKSEIVYYRTELNPEKYISGQVTLAHEYEDYNGWEYWKGEIQTNALEIICGSDRDPEVMKKRVEEAYKWALDKYGLEYLDNAPDNRYGIWYEEEIKNEKG